MIDDFDTCVDDAKYVDDSTLYEIVFVGETGQQGCNDTKSHDTILIAIHGSQYDTYRDTELFRLNLFIAKQNLILKVKS